MQIRKEIIIGLIAILSIAVFIWGYKFLKGENILQKDKQYYAIYPHIDQLSTASPVLINGYEVGSVIAIELLSKKDNFLKVSFTVNSDIDVPKGSTADLRSESVLGGKTVVLNLNGFCSGDDCLPSGSEVQGKVQGMIESMLSIDALSNYLETAGEGVSGFIDTLDASLKESADSNGVGKSVNDATMSIENIKGATESFKSLVESLDKSLPPLVHSLNAVVSNVESQNNRINTIIENLDALSAKLNNLELDQTVNSANSLIAGSSKTVKELKTTVDELNSFVGKVNSEDGTLGMLTNDRELYDKLLESTESLNLLLKDLKGQPYRYLNFSVFGKKAEKAEKEGE